MKWTFEDQRQCLQLIRRGKSYSEIGEIMGRSKDAVARYVKKQRKIEPHIWRKITPKKVGVQLCWGCYYASGATKNGWKCPWADRLEPVEGWTAKLEEYEHYVSGNVQTMTRTWNITACPHFEEG